MPEYLAPGVFVEEIDSGSKPIEGVGVSTAAFVGYAKSGEFNKPKFITSWGDFVREFGEDDATLLPALCAELSMTPAGILTAKRAERKSLADFADETLTERSRAREKAGTSKNGHCDNYIELKKKYKLSPSDEPWIKGSYLAYAVKGYFDNGGSRAYVVRVPRISDLDVYSVKALPGPVAANANIGGVEVRAIKAGTGGNSIKVDIVDGPNPNEFQVKFTDGSKSETLPKTGFFSPDGTTSAKGNIGEVVGVQTATRPQATAASIFLTGGLDEQAKAEFAKLPLDDEVQRIIDEKLDDDLMGDSSDRRGALGLQMLDDVNFICVPDLMAGAFERRDTGAKLGPEVCVLTAETRDSIKRLQKLLVDFCEGLNDRIAILDPLPNLDPQGVKASIKGQFSCDHGQAAMYYPWLRVEDKLNRREKGTILVPPCGHVAGVFARTAIEKGVHKAPANEAVRGIAGLEREISKADQEILNPDGINCIRTFPNSGTRIWGARTLATVSNPSWRYVNVRQIFNYLERSIERGTQWVVFEPNDHDLWDRVRRNISAFLWTAWKEGMLFGTVPEEAFYVKCNAETNPQAMIDLGRLYVEIGINPVKPAEFVIIRMGQWAGGSEKSEG